MQHRRLTAVLLLLTVILNIWPSITVQAVNISDPRDLGTLNKGQPITRIDPVSGSDTVLFHDYWTVIVDNQPAGEDLVAAEPTQTVTKNLEAKPAVPTAFFRWTGTPKENRKVVFDSAESYGSERYPVDFSQNRWEFILPAGVFADAIKIVTSPDLKTRQVLFKEPGDYCVRLAVKNTKGTISEWYEQVIRQFGLVPD